MTELKCPKCGETEEIYDTFNINGEGYGIKCGNCGYEIKDCESEEDAEFKWKSENDPNALRPCPLCGHDMKLERIQWLKKTTVEIKHVDMSAKLYVCNLRYIAEYDNDVAEKCIEHFIERWNRRVKG